MDYDASAGVWSIDLCISINKDSQLVGVGKASLDVSRWLRGTKVSIGQMEASVMFVRRDGTILYRDKVVPLEAKASEWHGSIAISNAPGWRVTKTGEIQGYAPIQLPRTILDHEVIMPRWSLVLCLPEAEALRPVTQLSMAVLAIGLAFIVVIFLAGLYLVDRIVIRRIYRIRQATRITSRCCLMPGRTRSGHSRAPIRALFTSTHGKFSKRYDYRCLIPFFILSIFGHFYPSFIKNLRSNHSCSHT